MGLYHSPYFLKPSVLPTQLTAENTVSLDMMVESDTVITLDHSRHGTSSPFMSGHAKNVPSHIRWSVQYCTNYAHPLMHVLTSAQIITMKHTLKVGRMLTMWRSKRCGGQFKVGFVNGLSCSRSVSTCCLLSRMAFTQHRSYFGLLCRKCSGYYVPSLTLQGRLCSSQSR